MLLILSGIGSALPAAAEDSATATTDDAAVNVGQKVQAISATVGAANAVQVATTDNPEPRADAEFEGPEPDALVPEATTAVASDKAPSAAEAVPADAPTTAAPNDFTFFRNSEVTAVPGSVKSSTDEPSVSYVGDTVFMTGNWWAARSLDGGSEFDYISPYSAFPSSYGGFCCDQTTYYDPHYNITIWQLQYVTDGNSNNAERIAVAQGEPGLQNLSFYYYDFTPQQVGYASGFWADYPEISASYENLFLAYNVYDSGGNYAGSVINRIALASLAQCCAGFNYGAYSNTGGTYAPAQGAYNTMYLMQHVDTDTLRLWTWADSAGSASTLDINHTSYAQNAHVCTSPDGHNACGRDDSRPKGGWVANGVIGFFWDASQGSQGFGTFPYPYVFVVRINESSKALIDQPYIWNNGTSWQYPSVSVNARGHLGWSLVYGAGGGGYPSSVAGLWDDIGTGYVFADSSAAAPNDNRWGDYTTVRTHSGWYNGYTFAMANYVITGACAGSGNSCANVRIRFSHFGRERDSDWCPDYGYEPDNVWSTANFASSNGTSSGHAFCSTNDQDWLYFYAYAGHYYSLDTLNLGGGNDTELTLYDSGINQLAYNDDVVSGNLASHIGYVVNTTGYYYLKATRLGGYRSWAYTYDVSISDDAPPSIPSITPFIIAGQELGNPSSGVYTLGVQERWTASDANGISSQQLQHNLNNAGWVNTSPAPSASATTYDESLRIGNPFRYRVRAYDAYGAYSDWRTGASKTLSGYQEYSSAITYTGSWIDWSVASFWGGKQKYTTGAAGTKSILTVTGTRVALIGTKRFDGGRADVYVDNVIQGTVDFYSASQVNRSVLKIVNFSSSGPHTIELRWKNSHNASSSGYRNYVDGYVYIH